MSFANQNTKASANKRLTEVGLLPADWTVVPLAKLAEKIMVGIASAATHAYRDQGVVMFRNQNIRPGLLNTDDVLFIDPDYEQTYKNKRLKRGDLLTARTGYPGTTSLVPDGFDGSQSFTTLITRPRADSVHAPYLCLYINSRAGQRYFEQAQIGGGQKNVNAASLKLLPVALPATDGEQRSIAEALADAHSLIDSLEQLLTKKRQIKQGAMQELLTGKRRVPGFGEEWSSDVLRNLVETPITDGPHMTPVFVDSGVPFLSVNNLIDNQIDFTDLRYITREDDQIFARKCKPQRGDVLLGKAASVGKVAIVEDDVDFNIWSPIALIRPGVRVASKFLFYQLQSQSVLKQINVLTNASSQGNLGMGDIERLQIQFPCTEEQLGIANVLSDMDCEISSIEARLSKARALKQAMAQALLTGRIRLVEPTT